MKNEAKGNGRFLGIVACFFLFAMISFVTNLAAPVGTIWGNQYSWAGMLGNLMNFAAYLFMGIPAGQLLLKIGYKKTALWALVLGFVGMGLQLLSSYVGAETSVFSYDGAPVMLNFIIYLLGAFVAGFCVCMLNTVVNPMLNILGGGGKKGNMLLQFGGSTNSLAGTLTPFFVGMLIGEVTKDTSMSNVTVLLYIAMAVFAASFLVISFINIPEPHQHRAGAKAPKYSHSPWSFRHTVNGVIGIFFYVGIEVGIPGVLIFYLSNSEASGITENATAVAGAVAACYWLLMLVGRILGGFVSMVCSSRVQLIAVASVAIALVVAAILIPSTVRSSMISYSVADGFAFVEVPVSALLLVLCGLCTSVMWGGIFNLAVEGLGKYTAQASGIFMMMVVGGGVMPFVQNWIVALGSTVVDGKVISTAASYMNSYWLVVAMLAYLLFYGLIGSKNVNTDIPVEEEPVLPGDPRNL